MAWAEERIFKKRPGNLRGYAFAGCFEEALERVAQTIREDLKNGEWRGDFLKDEEAERLRQAVRHLEKCGIACYDINNMIDKLDWYVEADENRVLKLQKALNALPFGSTIKEDGILGEKTISAWETFSREFQKADCPKLYWKAGPACPIPASALEKVGYFSDAFDAANTAYGMASTVPKVADVIRRNMPELYKGISEEISKTLGEKAISDFRYISRKAEGSLRKFVGKVGVVKTADELFLVAGAAVDVIEAGAAVYDDVRRDGKFGRQSVSAIAGTATKITVDYLLFTVSAVELGMKLGAIFGPKGMLVGAVVMPIILSIAGDSAGAVVEWMINVTELSEERYGPTAARLTAMKLE